MGDDLGKVIHHYSAPSEKAVYSMDCSPDGKVLAVGQGHGTKEEPTLSLVEVESGKCIKVIEKTFDYSHALRSVLFNKDGSGLYYVMQTGSNYTLLFYDLTNEAKKIIGISDGSMTHGLTLDNTGDMLLTSGNPPKLWDTKTLNLIKEIPVREKNKNDIKDPSEVISAAISPDGNYVGIAGLGKGIINIYDIKQNIFKNDLNGSFGFCEQIIFDPTGKYIAVVDFYGRGVFIWDVVTGKRHLDDWFNEKLEQISCVCFQKKINYLALGDINSYTLMYDLDSGDELFMQKLNCGRIYDICFTPDDKYLISGAGGKITLQSVG